jgi:hypothetical protein
MYAREQIESIIKNVRDARAANKPSLFEDLQQNRKTIEVDGEELFVVEGDVLLDRDQLEIYALQQETLQQARALDVATFTSDAKRELLGMVVGGRVVRWPPGSVLSYSVLRTTFSAVQYDEIVAGMEQASNAWENTCGVRFQHRSQFDSTPSGAHIPQVLFTVRRVTDAPFIAAAFFPNDPSNRRRILIDERQYFDLSPPPAGFDRIGVLRHELGHVLGFRHENIRSGAPAVCPKEPLFDVFPLSDYDPQSVMHYFCGNRGTRELQITDLDRKGAEKVYGPPLSSVSFVDIPESAR